jgi:hypothetical protein
MSTPTHFAWLIVLGPFWLLGRAAAKGLGLALADDVECIDADVRDLARRVELLVNPPPPKTAEELLAEQLAAELGIECTTCLAIIKAAKAANLDPIGGA